MRTLVACALVAGLVAAGCTDSMSIGPTSPTGASLASTTSATAWSAVATRNEQACWGEATEALARLGEMGYHASHQDNPRLGLRNVARVLYDMGLLPDDSLQSLGAFLSSALGLSIDSCL